jgi:clan AA aspartic protease
MIRGIVNARLEAVVRLRLRGPGGAEADVDAVVDTGFSDALTLPIATVAALGLAPWSASAVVLADGSQGLVVVYEADVDWGGTWRRVLALAVGDEALIGMRLLAGHRLVVEVIPGGAVEITPLP